MWIEIPFDAMARFLLMRSLTDFRGEAEEGRADLLHHDLRVRVVGLELVAALDREREDLLARPVHEVPAEGVVVARAGRRVEGERGRDLVVVALDEPYPVAHQAREPGDLREVGRRDELAIQRVARNAAL